MTALCQLLWPRQEHAVVQRGYVQAAQAAPIGPKVDTGGYVAISQWQKLMSYFADLMK